MYADVCFMWCVHVYGVGCARARVCVCLCRRVVFDVMCLTFYNRELLRTSPVVKKNAIVFFLPCNVWKLVCKSVVRWCVCVDGFYVCACEDKWVELEGCV